MQESLKRAERVVGLIGNICKRGEGNEMRGKFAEVAEAVVILGVLLR